MNIRPQFRLRSLFILTAIVAMACIIGRPIVRGGPYAPPWEDLVPGLLGLVATYLGVVATNKWPEQAWPVLLMVIGLFFVVLTMILAVVR
jgi:hypothetical protein